MLSIYQVQRAVLAGDVDQIVANRERLPWADFRRGHEFIDLMADVCLSAQNDPRATKAMIALIDAAEEAGVHKVFELAETRRSEGWFLDPVYTFIMHGNDALLLRFLQSGFNPLAPHGKEGLTAMEFATKARRTSALDVLRAYVARTSMEDVLAEIYRTAPLRW